MPFIQAGLKIFKTFHECACHTSRVEKILVILHKFICHPPKILEHFTNLHAIQVLPGGEKQDCGVQICMLSIKVFMNLHAMQFFVDNFITLDQIVCALALLEEYLYAIYPGLLRFETLHVFVCHTLLYSRKPFWRGGDLAKLGRDRQI